MVKLLGHRQTKETATDKPHLLLPRHIPTLLILFAVGMRIAAHPPHRSEQALFTHSAPTSGV